MFRRFYARLHVLSASMLLAQRLASIFARLDHWMFDHLHGYRGLLALLTATNTSRDDADDDRLGYA
jgi:hypothetical protein